MHPMHGVAHLVDLRNVMHHDSLSLSASSSHAVQMVDAHLNSMCIVSPQLLQMEMCVRHALQIQLKILRLS